MEMTQLLKIQWHCLTHLFRPAMIVFPKEPHVVDHRVCSARCGNGETHHFCACGYGLS